MHTHTHEEKSPMSIISIEGLDKAGKHTAASVLTETLIAAGLKVKRFSMPNYDTPIGMLIQDWLQGRFQADTHTFELLQAADKQHAQTLFATWEQQGYDVLIIDRYLHSMWAYGAYDNDELWLQELTRYMRRPDMVLYLDVDVDVSMKRHGKFGDNDRYEADRERLAYTRDEYDCLFQEGAIQGADIVVKRIDANSHVSEVSRDVKQWITQWASFEMPTELSY